MIRAINVSGQSYQLSSLKELGEGGEAVVYELVPGKTVVKVYKTPDHPTYTDATQKTAAALRIEEHQKKLPMFPKGLPPVIVAPREIAYDPKGKVCGYAMEFVSGAKPIAGFADPQAHRAGLSNKVVQAHLIQLHDATVAAHRSQLVFGDFNDLNVLVGNGKLRVVDADSMQFGQFLTKTYTPRFVDPLLCNPFDHSPVLQKPHGEMSDWYAFTVMLFQSFLCIDPYGGVFAPTDASRRVPHGMRPLRRISVFSKEVKYPRAAYRPESFPDELLHFLQSVFSDKDHREVFPRRMLETLDWRPCQSCGAESARGYCPVCGQAPKQVAQTVTVRGKVTATVFFDRRGATIVCADFQGGKMRFLYNEASVFRREDQRSLVAGSVDPDAAYVLQGEHTWVAKDGVASCVNRPAEPKFRVDTVNGVASIAGGPKAIHYVHEGVVRETDSIAPTDIGRALSGRTTLWSGEHLGFGFYRYGSISSGFIFVPGTRVMNESVEMPQIRGHLIKTVCSFGKDQVWFFWTAQDGTRRYHGAACFNKVGKCLAKIEADDGAQGDLSWLGVGVGGKCAVGDKLLAATDDGLVQVGISGGQMSVVKAFPDTEPFVDPADRLFVGNGGVYVVSASKVTHLQIS
jgi:hypothetical protein